MSDPLEQRTLPRLGPEAYVGWRASGVGAITEHLQSRLLLEIAGEVAAKDILDVGCGDGAFAAELSRRGARVSAIDASDEMIAAARKNSDVALGIQFHVGVAQKLPFPDASFDVVIAKTVLCFVGDAAPVFAQFSRVLRPGGKLVIGELGRWSTWAASRRIRSWLGSPLWKLGHFRTPNELTSLAQAAGLQPGQVVGAIYYPRSIALARLMSPYDGNFSRLTTFGAAFIALEARKSAH